MSDDYISRELVAVGLALKVKRRDFDAIDLQDAQRFIASLPAVDVRPVPTARWIDFDDGSMCSGCGASHDGVNRNYCPNCGAKMGGTDGRKE